MAFSYIYNILLVINGEITKKCIFYFQVPLDVINTQHLESSNYERTVLEIRDFVLLKLDILQIGLTDIRFKV